MNRILTASLGLAAGAGLLVATTAGPATADPRTTLQTALTGAQEVPGPGDPDGRGNGVVKVDRVSGEICVVITANRVAPLTLAHIHEARPTASGPVVVNLTPLQQNAGKFQGCVDDASTDAVADDLATTPGDYYLNVHNAAYPGGALRGNLG